ncbi:hypothetical protein [Thalassotalea euphylliae]|nr:hypothetical protein [Thalassotalea euphylliae]
MKFNFNTINDVRETLGNHSTYLDIFTDIFSNIAKVGGDTT